MNFLNYKLTFDTKYISFYFLLFFQLIIPTGNAIKQKALLLQQISSSLNSLAHNTVSINRNISRPTESRFDGYTFDEWYSECQKLPFYRNNPTVQPYQAVKYPELKRTIQKFVEVNSEILTEKQVWIDHPPKTQDHFFTTEDPLKPIQPFVQKLIINTDTRIAFHGDFHGDVHSMVKYIKALEILGYMDGFTIKNPSKFYLIFLGDYVDRGIYGAEVLYTLMRLKIANPNNVIIIRGNHEEAGLNKRDGFMEEIEIKYSHDTWLDLTRIYDLLPVALYLGSGSNIKNYLLCTHGGLEDRFDSRNLLTSPNKLVYDWLKFTPNNRFPENYNIGFMWNDFIVDTKQQTKFSTRGQGLFEYNKQYTEQFLKNHSNDAENYFLKGIFRAHQHGDRDMVNSILNGNGVSKLWLNRSSSGKKIWDNIVATFLVAPDTPYGKDYRYNYDAFAILTTAELFKNWKLEIYNNEDIFSKDLRIVNKSHKTREALKAECKKLIEISKQKQALMQLHEKIKITLEMKLKTDLTEYDRNRLTDQLENTLKKIATLKAEIKI